MAIDDAHAHAGTTNLTETWKQLTSQHEQIEAKPDNRGEKATVTFVIFHVIKYLFLILKTWRKNKLIFSQAIFTRSSSMTLIRLLR